MCVWCRPVATDTGDGAIAKIMDRTVGVQSGRRSNASFKGAVVHAMADGEWGGVQFEVAAAAKLPSGNGKLLFRRGGWQQARTASLKGFGGPGIGSRFYIEVGYTKRKRLQRSGGPT